MMNEKTMILFILISLPLTVSAAVVHVPGDQPTIQAGIDAAAEGDTVMVADGTFSGHGNRDLDFQGKSITVKSQNGPALCIIDCGGSDGNRHRGFYFHSRENEEAVVEGFTIRNGFQGYGGGIYCYNASPSIRNNIITANGCEHDGGGIGCRATILGSAVITGNRIIGNEAGQSGGGISCDAQYFPVISNNIIQDNRANTGNGGGLFCSYSSAPIISDNLITGNRGQSAGGIFVYKSEPVINNNIISGNRAEYINGSRGGGLSCGETNCTLVNNLIAGNHADYGAGFFIGMRAYLTIVNSSIVGNVAGQGGGFYTSTHSQTIRPLITNSIIWGNTPNAIVAEDISPRVTYSDIEGGYAGTGNITGDPLFISGPFGDYYLSQISAGQAGNSPCVDTGNAARETIWGTTRSDSLQDRDVVDMGYHFRLPGGTYPETVILSGPDGAVDSPVLTFSFTGTDARHASSNLTFSYRLDDGPWSPYSGTAWATFSGLNEGEYLFQVRAQNPDGHFDPTPAARTFTVQGWDDHSDWLYLVTGPGPAPTNPPLVRTSQAQWLAYGIEKYGVNVACGNLDGIIIDEVITGPGPGAVFGPHVRGWNIYGDPLPGVSFFAYGTRKFGVNVSTGDLDGDGFDEIITGAGPAAVFGPHVRGWQYDGSRVTPVSGVSFMAYGTRKWGANVCCGDIDDDGYDEIITGPGPGAVFGPHVRAWNADGQSEVTHIPEVNFFAYGTRKYGVNVASGDLNESGYDEIITGPGPGAMFGAFVRTWTGREPGISFFAYTSNYGVTVAAGNADNDIFKEEVLTMPGPRSSYVAHAKAWNVDGGSATPVPTVNFVAYDRWMTYGGHIAGGRLH